MEITANLKYLRMSAKKVRLVIDMIRGKKVMRALDILSFSEKTASKPVKKLLESAIANAKHNHKLTAEQIPNLRIKSIVADGGPMYKRWTPKAHGSAAPIRKRTTHLKIVLTDKKWYES